MNVRRLWRARRHHCDANITQGHTQAAMTSNSYGKIQILLNFWHEKAEIYRINLRMTVKSH